MENSQENRRNYLALWAVPGIGSITSRKLIAYAGGIQEIFRLKKPELQKIPGIGPLLAENIIQTECFKKADEALAFAEKYKIQIQTVFDEDYPYRLKQCEDAPLILFTKGQPIETTKKYVAMVGTRSGTSYGKDFCERWITSLAERGHDAIIVSGLAYGIDIAAHKAALHHQLGTIGVLAHGLDTLYPVQHRKIAAEMLEKGGLVTEFFPGTFPDKNNFVRRNRIIAGLSDAIIVVESDVTGGALITAELANSYSRDVFAVPGRAGDKYSSGCNKLIKSNRAALIETVEDLEYQMGWQTETKPTQKQLFIEFTPEETKIMDLFNTQPQLNIDEISRLSELSMPKVSALLLNLEFAGAVKCLPGKIFYRT
ncbi:MAG: DNA-processing protein DprA [Salinivirgaceae bacterium]|nr:DNA-processing protein DprA [Salinivirgaceae bacterium]